MRARGAGCLGASLGISILAAGVQFLPNNEISHVSKPGSNSLDFLDQPSLVSSTTTKRLLKAINDLGRDGSRVGACSGLDFPFQIFGNSQPEMRVAAAHCGASTLFTCGDDARCATQNMTHGASFDSSDLKANTLLACLLGRPRGGKFVYEE